MAVGNIDFLVSVILSLVLLMTEQLSLDWFLLHVLLLCFKRSIFTSIPNFRQIFIVPNYLRGVAVQCTCT